MWVITEPEKAILRVVFPLHKLYAYSFFRWVLEFHATLDLEDPGIPGIRNMGRKKSAICHVGTVINSLAWVDISIVRIPYEGWVKESTLWGLPLFLKVSSEPNENVERSKCTL